MCLEERSWCSSETSSSSARAEDSWDLREGERERGRKGRRERERGRKGGRVCGESEVIVVSLSDLFLLAVL